MTIDLSEPKATSRELYVISPGELSWFVLSRRTYEGGSQRLVASKPNDDNPQFT